eukprot:8879300-Alexandrium_andersonii.AAC.1
MAVGLLSLPPTGPVIKKLMQAVPGCLSKWGDLTPPTGASNAPEAPVRGVRGAVASLARLLAPEA